MHQGKVLTSVVWCYLLCATVSESLSAQNLLGSHFGVPGLPASYDYVVVGGGTAGLTIARRLAANTSISVAVIEAGDFPEFSNGNYSEVPAYASEFTGRHPTTKNNLIDWYTYSVPQPALDNQSFLYDSGKMLGGTSGRNFLWEIRGTEGCFDKWADQVGDDTYRFSNFLPFFQRSNEFHPPDNAQRPGNSSASYNGSDWASGGGPIQVSYPSWANPISSWLIGSFQELGLLPLSSLTSGKLLGWSWIPMQLDPVTQTRSSSEQFLRQALLESMNLYVYKSSLAKRILFMNGTAVGVEVDTGGLGYRINATKEVILSAGTLRSPQLLMVSGIGPASALNENNVAVLADRPGVGQNLWDNVLVGPTYAVNVQTHDSLQDPVKLGAARDEFNNQRTGILTNSGGDIAGFEQASNDTLSPSTHQALIDNFPRDWPHFEYLILDAYFGDGTDSSFGKDYTTQHVAASVGIVASFSRGNVSINSSDTAQSPVVSPNWLSDPRDQELAVEAFKRGRALFTTNHMERVVLYEAYPGLNVSTDAQILQTCKRSVNSVYNAVGTNAMGRRDDPLAVTDSSARVIGVQGLRVVDASTFPFLPPGQPSATVYALAEKIAEDILSGLG